MNKISQTINESCFSCQNIGQISILVILVVSKCSIYDVKSPMSPIFRGPQTPHIATIFEKILQTILFYINESACHIFVTICNTFRFSNTHPSFMYIKWRGWEMVTKINTFPIFENNQQNFPQQLFDQIHMDCFHNFTVKN